MVQDHKIIFFYDLVIHFCRIIKINDPMVMISYFSWSRGFDPDDFMIYFPKTRDPVIPLAEISWSVDLNYRISMILWYYPAKYNPWSGDFTRQNQNSMIRWSLHLFFVTHLVFKSDPKVHWISTYASMIFCIVVINRNSLFPSLIPNFRFSTFGVPNKAPDKRVFFRSSSHP